MPSPERVNWQPISHMPLVASMIAGALNDTIDRIMAMSDLEIGLEALRGTLPPRRS